VTVEPKITVLPTVSIIAPSDPRILAALDDPSVHRRLDAAGMWDAIAAFPAHLKEAPALAQQVDWRSYKPTTPAGVCVCGMGGSAIGGDLARSYWEYESPVPMLVVRADRLPEYINRFWMVIVSSYSGNTTEALAAADDAWARGSNILALSAGGELAERARAQRWPLITVPGGLMPRAALGYSFGPVMLALMRWGIVPDREADLLRTAGQLADARTALEPTTPAVSNPAKQAAAALAGRIICVYGTTGYTDVAAVRLKSQLCENGKAVAFANSLPELNHNEIVGLDASGDPERLAVVVLRSSEEPKPAARRLDWLERRVAARGIPLVTLTSIATDRLSHLLSLVQMGDAISYYAAIATGHDPTPIPAITALKTEIG
jgi:glucose/mannose-6-phosphate isomerase